MQYLQKRTHACTFTCTSTRNDEKLDLAKLPIIRTKVIYATGFSVFNALYALFIVSFKRGRGSRTHKLAITAPHTSRRVKVYFCRVSRSCNISYLSAPFAYHHRHVMNYIAILVCLLCLLQKKNENFFSACDGSSHAPSPPYQPPQPFRTKELADLPFYCHHNFAHHVYLFTTKRKKNHAS